MLILTRERLIPRLSSLLVAPITTTVRNIPTEVVMPPADGLATECAANFDNVFTLDKTRLVARAAILPDDKLAEVCDAYRFAAGC